MPRVAYLLFALSGTTALILEVVWMRALARTFGSTAEASAATLAAFFLGLGLGAALGGRIAGRLARPLRAYGLLEIGVGLAAAAGLAGHGLEGDLYGALLSGEDLAGAQALLLRVGLALLLVGPAALFMGATFPVLAQCAVPRGRNPGRRGSLLYGLNTLGAALGALAAALWLPALLGWRGTWLLAAGSALAVGGLAVLLDAGPRAAARSTAKPAEPTGEGAPILLALVAFASGLLTLALQILAVRMFTQVFPHSVYVFGVVLAIFLLALAVGAGVARRLGGLRRSRGVILAILLGASAVLVSWVVPGFLWMSNGLQPPAPDVVWSAYVLRLLRDAGLVLFLPVVAAGAVLPWVMHMVGRPPGGAGRALGRLAAWNTLGAIAGSLLAGFVLLRLVGLWDAIRLIGLGYAALALLVGVLRRQPLGIAAGTVASLFVLAQFFVPAPAVRQSEGEELLFLEQGPAGTVAVLEQDGIRRLVHDNIFILGSTKDVRWEAMQAHVPLCLHPAPRRVFFLGLGTGITAGAGLDHPVESLEVAELLPDVIRASKAWFGPWTNGLFGSKHARVREDDARHHLRWSSATYDVIVGDLFFPWEPGTASLYTREHFQAVRQRLDEGGLFAQWLPCYQLSLEEVRGIARTMVDVFPQVTLWRGDAFARRPLLALVGHAAPTPLDPALLRQRASTLVSTDGDDLARDAEAMPFHLYAGNLTEAKTLLADARPVTDDRPWIVWTAPRTERRHQRSPQSLAVGSTLLAFEARLQEACPPERDPVLSALDERDLDFVRAGLRLREMAVQLDAGDRQGYMDALRRYVRLVPSAVRPQVERWVR